MVIHYPPARLRHNSDQPTAITNLLITTSGSFSTGEIPLGTPTCSARTRRGRWALYPSGDQVVVVWPRVPWPDHQSRLPVSWTGSAVTTAMRWTVALSGRSGSS
jgi:hypothetical protein